MSDLFDLRDRVAVITGGGGVLGGTMARYLARAGVRVAVLDLRAEHAEAVAADLREHADALVLAADVLDRDALVEARETVSARWGRLDILINAAGGNMAGATIGPDQTIFDLDVDAFEEVSRLNLNGTVLPTLVFAEEMARRDRGVVINISSMTATRAVTRVVGYSAAKAAVDNFTRWMATELALKYGDGLRVNAIAPGFFIGDQNRDLLLEADGSLTARGRTIVERTPMRRFGEADELCGTIHWLAGDASAFVTGVVVPIDGGFSAYSGV